MHYKAKIDALIFEQAIKTGQALLITIFEKIFETLAC